MPEYLYRSKFFHMREVKRKTLYPNLRVIFFGTNFKTTFTLESLFYVSLSVHLIQSHQLIPSFELPLFPLLYIELTISFLSGRKRTVNFRKQRL